MEHVQLFIAYHGTYNANGSRQKAEKLYDYLTENGISCYLYNDESAFTDTPFHANAAEKFLLVCNEHISVNQEGAIDETHSNGVFQELSFFAKNIYYNKSRNNSARVYGFGSFTTTMANALNPVFMGVPHFLELRKGGQECFDEVLQWVLTSEDTDFVTHDEASVDDILQVSQRLSRRSDYGLSQATYSERLLPEVEFDGGSTIDNILSLTYEDRRTYVIYANGGSGKSYSLKALWKKLLTSGKIPLYVSVRNCYEKYGDQPHPLYSYLINTYEHFNCDAEGLPRYLNSTASGWVLLLDGYNEAENITGIQNDLNHIDEYVTVFLTARDKSFVAGLDANSIIYLHLKPLSEKTVREYIASYNDPQITALLNDPSMLVMLKNPMLLTMFCNSFDSSGYDYQLSDQSMLTPGQLIEKCVIAQLRKTDSVHLRSLFTTLTLFPMAMADLYYSGGLSNMSTSRMEVTRELNRLLGNLDVEELEGFYLLEYADSWRIEVSDQEIDELTGFLRAPNPTDIRREMTSFERIMRNVLQFLSTDAEKTRVTGGIYRFDHQTSLNWYISYGIYAMAQLWPQRFEEIINVMHQEVGTVSENADDYEEQSEFVFDLIGDSCGLDCYRIFAADLFQRNFDRNTPKVYQLATQGISLYDTFRSNITDDEYADRVCTFCYSLYSLGKNTPVGQKEADIVRKYGDKLDQVIKVAERIKDDEFRDKTMAKINTIQGALCLGLRRLYPSSHPEETKQEISAHQKQLAQKAWDYQSRALATRKALLENGSGRYRQEIINRITHSYTSLGTVSYYLADYDQSIRYQNMAYQARKAICDNPEMDSLYRNDALIRIPINLNRINGSTLAKGDISRDTLLEMLEREIDLARINVNEKEVNGQISNFEREIKLIGTDREVLQKAFEAYENICDEFVRLFGYLSDRLNRLHDSLRSIELKVRETEKALKGIDEFINSSAFQDIVAIFNEGKGLTDLEEINKLAEQWDYRRKLADGGERQAITSEDDFVAGYRQRLIDDFRQLGMLDEKTEEMPQPDYILPLGGFGSSNLKRCLLARKVADRYPDGTYEVIALSSHRKIVQENEFEDIRHFAPQATSEFEEMDAAMKKAFDLDEITLLETHNQPDTRDYWSKITYHDRDDKKDYHNLSAPCYDENRSRANTSDTFRHFLSCFDVKPGSLIYLISTSLYEPYQMYILLPEAIKAGVRLQFIGCSYKQNDDEILATLCLVDLKSAVNAMFRFVNEMK